MAQSSKQAPFTSEFVGSILNTEKSSSVFLIGVFRFPSKEKVDRVG
jgi:hypothetical protein